MSPRYDMLGAPHKRWNRRTRSRPSRVEDRRSAIAALPRADVARHAFGGCLAVILLSGCGRHDLPIVARGSLVEIGTDRQDSVCAGTVDAMDDYVANVFEILGEDPPDHVFIRYEWLEDSDGSENRTIPTTDGIRVRTDRMMHEHELVHAVHLSTWPHREGYLAEGLAILLEADNGELPFEWPSSASLDEVIADGPLDSSSYPLAWFLVSQIVADHGFDGLRGFWLALPEHPDPADTRATYEELFAEPFETLIAPRQEMIGDVEVDVARTPCFYGVCGGPTEVLSSGSLHLEGPTGCAQDDAAIGPTGALDEVWRRHVVDIEPEADLSVSSTGGSGARLRRCGLRCDPSAHGEDTIPAGWSGDWPSWEGAVQIDVGAQADRLRPDQPPVLELSRL